MNNSPLVNYTKISPYSNNPRNNTIKKITIHHMAGDCSVETCGNVFQSSSSSSNYGVDSDGRVGMYVEEENRSWASDSRDNDHQAITIEVANDSGNPDWHVSDKALAKLIELCTDICKRNGIEKLNYTSDTSGNLTRHNMFSATGCPGPYLQSKFSYIANEVNKRLLGNNPIPEQSEELYRVRKAWDDASGQIGAFKVLENAISVCKEGYKVFNHIGNVVYTPSEPQPSERAVYYQTCEGSRWLPEVKNLEDYAGTLGKPISGLRVKASTGDVYYRSRILNGDWLSDIKNAGTNNADPNSYSGIFGMKLDAVQVRTPGRQARYRVHNVGRAADDWCNWITSGDEYRDTGDSQAYAGNFGVAIDGFQMEFI